MGAQGLVAPSALIEQLQWRYAVKKFDPHRTIPEDVWQALAESLRLSPSSFGLQPWRFFVIRDRALKAKLLPHSWNQQQVVDASHVVVLARKSEVGEAEADAYLTDMAQTRGVPLEQLAGFGKMLKGFLAKPPLDLGEWSTRQVYIALGQFMTAAAMLGVDTCPMEGFLPDQYDEILGLPALGYRSVLVCPAGYRAADDAYANLPKVRFPAAQMLTYLGE
ncbi:MAG: NAD(P)H-dependent oxidoreductase [Oscillatoriales cyanobacterium SM2_1_8]|nr:NAD(P)H-dependent oxidoreductase [Oscillatoriales cyanobacterium SM2_1_8]